MRVGITSFGLSSSFPISNIIAEYKQFIETNSKYKLSVIINDYPTKLTQQDFWLCSISPYSYFAAPWSITPANQALLPTGTDVDVNIILWDNLGLNVCWGGGTWGRNAMVNGALFVSIPFAWPVTSWGPWTYNYSQTLSHEWIHSANIILSEHGYVLPNIDACSSYGFCSCDPCSAEGCTCTGANILINSNFDTTTTTTTNCPTGLTSCPTNWSFSQTGTTASFYYTTGRGSTGYAVGLHYTALEVGKYAYWYQIIPVIPGTYDISGWVEYFNVVRNASNPNAGAYISVTWYDSLYNILGSKVVKRLTGTSSTYNQYTSTATAPSGTTHAMVAVWLNDASGTVYFDDLSLTIASPFYCNDYGWQNCQKFILSTISDPMYLAIGEICSNPVANFGLV